MDDDDDDDDDDDEMVVVRYLIFNKVNISLLHENDEKKSLIVG